MSLFIARLFATSTVNYCCPLHLPFHASRKRTSSRGLSPSFSSLSSYFFRYNDLIVLSGPLTRVSFIQRAIRPVVYSTGKKTPLCNVPKATPRSIRPSLSFSFSLYPRREMCVYVRKTHFFKSRPDVTQFYFRSEIFGR